MPEYSLEFSESLIKAAEGLAAGGMDSVGDKRAVLYLSLVSCEITLKALLERAGWAIYDLIKCSHDLSKLLALFSKTEVEEEICPGRLMWVPAARIRSI